ncbi:MAG: hypothetical protein ACI8ZO_000867 [Flavobacteriales bacterium]|jgi:hypothetical protein
MILVYATAVTNRLKYTFKQLFKELLKSDVKFTSNAEEFTDYIGAKISYARAPIGDELFFKSRKLLFEKGVMDQELSVNQWKDKPCFFDVGDKSEFPFDPFAASFYLMSRYEEYLPHKRDDHGRFTANQSLAYENKFLNFPIVDFWAIQIASAIKDRFPNFEFTKRQFTYMSTIDVDNAYAYIGKGLFRNAAGLIRSMLHLNFQEAIQRLNVLRLNKRDPFDTFSYLLRQGKRYGFEYIFFFLLGDYTKYDKNVPVTSSRLRLLIKSIADDAKVGIHPSYYCQEKEGQLKKETGRLAKIVNDEVHVSRQHYLRMTLPQTYRWLIDNDITEDYTMGYPSQIGFRAGTCSAYFFYDLDLEAPTNLKVHPFAFMEGTLRDYMAIKPEQAMTHIKPLIDNVKEVNGTFISLWHNDSVSNSGVWKGWKAIYEQMLKEVYEQ